MWIPHRTNLISLQDQIKNGIAFLKDSIPNITHNKAKGGGDHNSQPSGKLILSHRILLRSPNPNRIRRLHIIMINCMSNGVLERTDSYKVSGSPKQHIRLCFIKVERSWSGNLAAPPRYEEVRDDHDDIVVGAGKVKRMMSKVGHRRYSSEAGALLGEPKLVRSSGMRRDWSFEDLRTKMIDKCREGYLMK